MPPGLRLSEFQAVKLPSIAPGPRCEAAGAGPRACSPTDGAVGASAGAVLGAVPAEPDGSAGAMPGSVPAEGLWYSNGTSGETLEEASAGAVLGAVPAEPDGSAGAMPGSVPAEGFWYSNGTSGGVKLDGTCTPLARACERVKRSDTVCIPGRDTFDTV